MLNIVIGKCPNAILKTSKYFDYEYEPEWITNELSREMIKNVDKSEVMGGHVILNPLFGSISPTMLSGGVKTLMLIYFDKNNIFGLSQCGDNCVNSLLEIGKRVDRTVWLGHIMRFHEPDEIKKDFKVNIVYDNMTKSKAVDNMRDFLIIYNEFNGYYIDI